MTLADAIKQAVNDQNAELAQQVMEFMRHRMGFDYGRCNSAVRQSGVDVAEWEALLQAAD